MLVQFLTVRSREYWMIYRGPAFVAIVWLLVHPHPPVELNDWGEGGGGEAKSYDSEKVGSSVHHSILPGPGDPGYKPSRCN